MNPPQTPRSLILWILTIAFLLGVVQMGVITIAFEKLGLSPQVGFMLLVASLFGSLLNLPLFTMTTRLPQEQSHGQPWQGATSPATFTGKTIVAVNIGGGLLPVSFSLYLMGLGTLESSQILLATTLVTLLCYLTSQPIPKLGIGIPILIAPLSATTAALLIAPEQSAQLAYISGTLGVLIGADLMRLKDIRKLGAPVASIGGAGTFDGIFITGIVAAFLT